MRFLRFQHFGKVRGHSRKREIFKSELNPKFELCPEGLLRLARFDCGLQKLNQVEMTKRELF